MADLCVRHFDFSICYLENIVWATDKSPHPLSTKKGDFDEEKLIVWNENNHKSTVENFEIFLPHFVILLKNNPLL